MGLEMLLENLENPNLGQSQLVIFRASFPMETWLGDGGPEAVCWGGTGAHNLCPLGGRAPDLCRSQGMYGGCPGAWTGSLQPTTMPWGRQDGATRLRLKLLCLLNAQRALGTGWCWQFGQQDG